MTVAAAPVAELLGASGAERAGFLEAREERGIDGLLGQGEALAQRLEVAIAIGEREGSSEEVGVLALHEVP